METTFRVQNFNGEGCRSIEDYSVDYLLSDGTERHMHPDADSGYPLSKIDWRPGNNLTKDLFLDSKMQKIFLYGLL